MSESETRLKEIRAGFKEASEAEQRTMNAIREWLVRMGYNSPPNKEDD